MAVRVNPDGSYGSSFDLDLIAKTDKDGIVINTDEIKIFVDYGLDKYKQIIKKYNLDISEDLLNKSYQNIKKAITPEYYLGIEVSPASGFYANLINNIGNLAKSISITAFNTDKLKFEHQRIKSKTYFMNERQKENNINDILIKNPFTIFANGELYKKGRAGTKSYEPLTPYEPYKYITGDIASNEFDDILQGRAHYKLAGNREYFNHIYPEAQWQNPDIKTMLNKYIMINLKNREVQIKKGYLTLDKLGWGDIGDINLGWNKVPSLQKLYNKELEDFKNQYVYKRVEKNKGLYFKKSKYSGL